MKRVLLIVLLIITLTGCNTGDSSVPGESNNNEDIGSNFSGSGVSGVWMGFYVPIGQYSPQERYLIMYDDGTLYHDLPLTGLDHFDQDKSKTSADESYYWGTYSLDGNSGTYIYNESQQPWELTLEKDGTLKLGADSYYRTKSVDGLRLNGAWSTAADPENANLEIDGLINIIRFTPDGQFHDEGLMAGFFNYCDTEASSGGPGKGTYEINNYTLHLSYDDGRTRTAAFSLFLSKEQEPTPEIICIHRTALYLLGN